LSWHLIVERRLMEAFSEGLFENLPGAGKPLQWDDESLVPPAWRAAFHLLAQSGHAPEWIVLDGEIREDLRTARQGFAREAAGRDSGDPDYKLAVERMARRLDKINKAIDELNLRVPSVQLERARLNLEHEIQRLHHAEAGSAVGGRGAIECPEL
jgi:hypothetical protein